MLGGRGVKRGVAQSLHLPSHHTIADHAVMDRMKCIAFFLSFVLWPGNWVEAGRKRCCDFEYPFPWGQCTISILRYFVF